MHTASTSTIANCIANKHALAIAPTETCLHFTIDVNSSSDCKRPVVSELIFIDYDFMFHFSYYFLWLLYYFLLLFIEWKEHERIRFRQYVSGGKGGGKPLDARCFTMNINNKMEFILSIAINWQLCRKQLIFNCRVDYS